MQEYNLTPGTIKLIFALGSTWDVNFELKDIFGTAYPLAGKNITAVVEFEGQVMQILKVGNGITVNGNVINLRKDNTVLTNGVYAPTFDELIEGTYITRMMIEESGKDSCFAILVVEVVREPQDQDTGDVVVAPTFVTQMGPVVTITLKSIPDQLPDGSIEDRHISSNNSLIKAYNSLLAYSSGAIVLYLGKIYKAIVNTTAGDLPTDISKFREVLNYVDSAKLFFTRVKEFTIDWYERAKAIEYIRITTNSSIVGYYISIIRKRNSSVSDTIFRISEYNTSTNILIAHYSITKSEVNSDIFSKTFQSNYSTIEVTVDFSKVTTDWNTSADMLAPEMLLTISKNSYFSRAQILSGIYNQSLSVVANVTQQNFYIPFSLIKDQSYQVKNLGFDSSTNFSLQIFGVKNGIQSTRQLLVYSGFSPTSFIATDNFDSIRVVLDSLTNTTNATFNLRIRLNDVSTTTVGVSTDNPASESSVGLVNFRRFGQRLFSRYQEFDINWYTRALGIENITVYTENPDVNYHVSIIRTLSTSTSIVFRLTEYIGNSITTQLIISKSEAIGNTIFSKSFSTLYSKIDVVLDFSKITTDWNMSSDLNLPEMVLTVSKSRFVSLSVLQNEIITTAKTFVVKDRSEINLYFDAMTFQSSKQLFCHASGSSSTKILRREGYIRYIPNSIEFININYRLLDSFGKVITTKIKSIESIEKLNGNGSQKRIICGGDSYAHNGYFQRKARQMLQEDNDYTYIFEGTITANLATTEKTEGRSGWSTSDYLGAGTGSFTNAFWNTTTGQLDFQNYLSLNNIPNIDVLVWNIGINDLGNFQTSIASDTEISNIIVRLKTFLSKFLTDLPNAKVILTLPSLGGYIFKNASIDQSYRSYNLLRLSKAYIDNFDSNVFDSRVFVSSSTQMIDRKFGYKTNVEQIHSVLSTTSTTTYNDDSVHPDISGYNQMGIGLYAEIKKALL